MWEANTFILYSHRHKSEQNLNLWIYSEKNIKLTLKYVAAVSHSIMQLINS